MWPGEDFDLYLAAGWSGFPGLVGLVLWGKVGLGWIWGQILTGKGLVWIWKRARLVGFGYVWKGEFGGSDENFVV